MKLQPEKFAAAAQKFEASTDKDQPVTPDREALERVVHDAFRRWFTHAQVAVHVTNDVTDTLLPLLTEALDRARQQGREDAAQAIEEVIPEAANGLMTYRASLRTAAALARGGPNRKDEE